MARGICSVGVSGFERDYAPQSGATDRLSARSRRLRCFSFKIPCLSLLAAVNCILCALAFGGDFSLPTRKPKDRVSEIPIKIYQQYLIVVDGRIGNLEHQKLLLDTGTSPSMIDKTVAQKLGLHGPERRLELFNKDVLSERVTLPDLELGPLRRQNLLVMVADFAAVAKGLGTRIDAVVGLDVLGRTSFTVDYLKRRIVFGASVEAHTAPFTAVQQFITVNMESRGRQLHLLLDTGAQQLVLFQNHLHGVDYLWSPVYGSGQNVSGAFSYGTVILEQGRIGTKEVGPQRASVATQSDAGSEFDGLIGISCLRPKRVSFDFERQLLGWSD
jgi:predicted aspartyl protease